MGVIINEFEIITEQQPEPSGQQDSSGQTNTARQTCLRPEDIERIQQRRRERQARVWAD